MLLVPQLLVQVGFPRQVEVGAFFAVAPNNAAKCSDFASEAA